VTIFRYLLDELRFFFRTPVENQKVQAVPGGGMSIPIWLLGSSGFSARLAGQLGLPFAFAGHFSPDYILPAMKLYRESFEASDELEKPYAMLGDECRRRRLGRRSAISGDDAISILSPPDPRNAGTDAAAGQKHGRDLDSRRESGRRVPPRRFDNRKRATVKNGLEKILAETSC
jgi:alkanesulfonate monooxygenase SsuD/methylene tetrahydromethanopterin reductase-like flavin-dependent oxidoreductase (luciferase family)